VQVIVHFIALLELLKRGAVVALQKTPFDDILIEGQRIGVPRYE
jgi:chromatin segregation and condensation protein Rec8/ScpA/Scc1 (kleisin family)